MYVLTENASGMYLYSLFNMDHLNLVMLFFLYPITLVIAAMCCIHQSVLW